MNTIPVPYIDIMRIHEARARIAPVIYKTPLQYHEDLSKKYNARLFLKREDLQAVRSYKLRGAYNKIAQLTEDERARGIVCASAGNHAQGVAYSCKKLKVNGMVFMPETTPQQKRSRVAALGEGKVQMQFVGTTFDEAYAAARAHVDATDAIFIHPFDDVDVIAGQGTIAAEIVEQLASPVDHVVVPIGGGGLASGISSYLHHSMPSARVHGAQAYGAASMHASVKAGRVVTLDALDTFADGVAIRTVGLRTYEICSRALAGIHVVAEAKICETMIDLYNNDGMVTEPAGALSVAALDALAASTDIRGATVVCVISGGNNDLRRYPDILARCALQTV